MLLPEHIVERWVRRALSRRFPDVLHDEIIDAIHYLKQIERGKIAIENAATRTIDTLNLIINDLAAAPEKFYGTTAGIYASTVNEAISHAVPLTYVNGYSIVHDVVAEVNFYDAWLPMEAIKDALGPEIHGIVDVIPPRAEKLIDILYDIRSIFHHQQSEDWGFTDEEADEIIGTLEEIVEELREIDNIYKDAYAVAASGLIEILKQLDEALLRAAGEE